MKSARWSLFSVCRAGMGVMDLGTETGKDCQENPEKYAQMGGGQTSKMELATVKLYVLGLGNISCA